MKYQAIALCRVSTPEQKLSNSLNRQEESVLNAAKSLDVDIVLTLSGDLSSKVGKNVKRKDLLEAYEFAKANKKVKYLIVDEVDRFMRSIAEMFYWIIKFQEIGVKVHFAANPELNGDDAKARLLLSLDGFKSEGSNEERQNKSIWGHEKAIREGRYTFPPKPGYIKGTKPGVHEPHPVTFKLLQTAFSEVISHLFTPQEALKRLNDSDFNKVHAKWNMDKFRRFATDPYYAGILVIDRQVKERNASGQHRAMISLEEHEQLNRILKGSYKPRGAKKQYNPEFPMNKIMTCGDCGGEVKFTGAKGHNGFYRDGKTGSIPRKSVKYYWKYRCRGCGRAYHRNEVHIKLTQRFSELRYLGNQTEDFIEALETVWKQKQKDKLLTINSLNKRKGSLLSTKSKLVIEMATCEAEFKQDIRAEVENIKAQISEIETQVDQLSGIDKDLVRFTEWSLQYTDDLLEDWWDLDHENRVWCQQLVFPGGITFNSDKKVGTPKISPLYSLKPNKKDLSKVEKSLLVELVGTAPTSDW